MISLRKIIVVLAALVLAAAGNAQNSSELSTGILDSRTLAVQQKVERLFVDGEFERAYFIYRNELVPIGDKYAQYMVGFMHETGAGVARDPVRAAAWYRLSAERDMPEFVAVYHKVFDHLDDDQQRRAESLYVQLRRQYSDLVILLATIKEDVDELRERTGSRLSGSNTSPVTVVEQRSSRSHSGPDYYGSMRTQLEKRLRLIVELGGFEGVNTNPDDVNIRQLERLVEEAVGDLEN